MPEILKAFLTSRGFIPHGHCYLWKPELLWLHVASDSLTVLAYYSIPIMLVYFVGKRRDLPFDWIFLLFSTFIVACGTTHLLEIWTIWHPTYWLSGFVKALTALVSLCTAVLLIPLIPKAVALPSPAQLEAANFALMNEITQRQRTTEALHRANEELEIRVQKRTAQLAKINESLKAEISERKQAETTLRESEQRFRAIFDQAAVGIIQAGIDGSLLLVNQKFCDIVGYTCEELLKRTFHDITHPDDHDTDLKYIHQMVVGEISTNSREKRYIHKDGSTVWINLSVSLIHSFLGAPKYLLGIVEDISDAYRQATQRKQVEEALKQTQFCVDSATDAISWIGTDFSFMYVNDAMCRSLGYSRSQLLSMRVPDVAPDTPLAVCEEVLQSLTKQAFLKFESRHRRKDGSIFPIEVVLNHVNFNGLEYTCCFARDISDRKRQEQELHLLQTITQAISEAPDFDCALEITLRKVCEATGANFGEVWIPNSDKNILELSPAWYSSTESLNQFRRDSEAFTFSLNTGIPGRVWASKQPEWIQDVSLQPEAIFLRNQIALKVGLKAAIGVPIVVDVSDATLTTSQVLAVFVFFRFESCKEDKQMVELVSSVANQLGLVIQRKRAEEALWETNQMFQALIQAAPVSIDIVDPEGNVKLWNPGAQKMFGWSEQEALGRSLPMIPPESWDDFYRFLRASLQEGTVCTGLEGQRVRKDGSMIHVSLYTAPLRDPKGNIIGGLDIITDITERKRAEQEIIELNQNLERRVAERTTELEAANKELEAFSFSVSHDLRAPLRGIDGFSQALLDRYADQLNEKGKHYLQRIRAGTQRMGELIDDLLKLSRVTRSQMQRTKVDLSILATAIAAELQQTQPERQVEWVIAPELFADGDARLLQIVLENLLNNSWKFTSFRTQSCIEFNAILQKDAEVAYFVRDNGAGFDMAYANKLFGAFGRLHSPTQFPGTGIGLATVQRIIHRHGGQVWAESTVEQGATFYFTL